MVVFIPAILFLLWQIQAFNEGKEEGLFYSCKYSSPNKALRMLNEHRFWTTQRVIIASGFIAQYVTIAFSQSFALITSVFMTLFLGMAYILVFSFWHNGKLYLTRNQYGNPDYGIPYPGGWKANINGKAFFDFTYKTRLIMLLSGWALFLLFILLNLYLCGRI